MKLNVLLKLCYTFQGPFLFLRQMEIQYFHLDM